MASINGIKIQNLQWIQDEDGCLTVTGLVIYKENILGRWTRNESTDSDYYEFDKDILREEAKKVADAELRETGERRYFSVDQLLFKLANLCRKEEEYKKGLALGYKTFVCADNFEDCLWYCDKAPLEEIKKSESYVDFLKQVKEKLGDDFRERLIMITDSPDDFTLSV